MIPTFRFFTRIYRHRCWASSPCLPTFLSHSILTPQPKLVTMKFDTPLFHQLFTPETKTLSEIFRKYNHELRIAGGAVRDLLMNKLPEDVDFATTATPEEMKEMFNAEGVRMFNRKGEGHGTVTVRINDKQNFEITTLRVDLHTDGRHAEVEFTTDWELDSGRRDLTINAMFLGLDGVLYDYFHGVDDLEKRLVKFVGDPACRIREDYLRILRYFRFYGRIAVKPDEHDSATLQAIAENIGGLEKIAGERLWVELKKILGGNYAKHIMLQMIDLGIAPFIGLPTDPDVREFEKVCERSKLLKPHSMTILTALLRNEEEILNLNSRLKFSKYEKDLALFIDIHRKDNPNDDILKKYKLLILESKNKVSDTREWVNEVLKYRGDSDLLNKIHDWQLPKFPVSGHLLIQRGCAKNSSLNVILSKLRAIWIESDCTMTREDLLSQLEIISKQTSRA